MADAVVGVQQATSPDRFIDNALYTNDDATPTYRQRVENPELMALMRQLLESLQRFGSGFDPAGRLVVRLTDMAGTAQIVNAAQSGTWNVGTVTTVTTLTGQTNLGGYAANPVVFANMQSAANILRAGIAVS